MHDMTKTAIKPILLIGGYGSVGSKAVAILQDYYPSIPLVVGGRNPEKAKTLLEDFENVTAIAIDLKQPDLNIPADVQFSAVVTYTNDTTYNAQSYAQRKGIPYVTVSASVAEMGMALACYVNHPQQAAVVLSSQWMGGIADALTIAYAKDFQKIDSVKITAIVDTRDEIGQESGEEEIKAIFALNPYSIAVDKGNYSWLKTDEEKYYSLQTLDGHPYEGYAFPIADILSLKNALNADTIRFYTTEGDSHGTKAGKPLTHDIVIEISGKDQHGNTKNLHKELIYPKGQAHLTALGSFLALERVMDLHQGVTANLYLGANLIEANQLKQRLEEQGAFLNEKK